MENFVIIRSKSKTGKVTAKDGTAKQALKLKELISDIYVNETGGITIFIDKFKK